MVDLYDPMVVQLFEVAALAVVGWFITYLRSKQKKNTEAASSNLKRIENVEKRLDAVELKVGPFWEIITKELPRLLIKPHTPAYDELMKKYLELVNGNEDAITVDELMILRDKTLEIVRERSVDTNIAASVLAGINYAIVKKANGKLLDEAKQKWTSS